MRVFLLLLIAVPVWALASDQEEIEAHYQRGVESMNQSQHNQAIQAFRRCLDLDASHYDARVRLGEIYLRQQMLGRAADVLHQAIEIEPDRVEARLVLAEVLATEGRFFDSRQEIQQVLLTDPDGIPADARMKVGYLLGIAGGMLPNLEEAKRQFEKVLEVNPDHVGASFQLGIVELRLGQFSEAAERFASIIPHYPQHFEAQYQLGVAYLRSQNYRKAIPALKEALKIRPGKPPNGSLNSPTIGKAGIQRIWRRDTDSVFSTRISAIPPSCSPTLLPRSGLQRWMADEAVPGETMTTMEIRIFLPWDIIRLRSSTGTTGTVALPTWPLVRDWPICREVSRLCLPTTTTTGTWIST